MHFPADEPLPRSVLAELMTLRYLALNGIFCKMLQDVQRYMLSTHRPAFVNISNTCLVSNAQIKKNIFYYIYSKTNEFLLTVSISFELFRPPWVYWC